MAQVHETEPVKTIVALKKTQRRFVLDETSIADLLGNPQFKTNITIGKVLKIVRALIDGNKASAAIAKQFEVEQAIVDKNDLDASVSEDPRLFYLSLETEHEESDYGNNSETIAVYPDYPVTLTAGTGGTVTGSGLYENGSIASIAAVPAPGYLFEGWYEDGQLLAGLPQPKLRALHKSL